MNFDQINQQETDEAIAREQAAAKAKAQAEKGQLVMELGKLEALQADENYAFFVERHLVPILQEEHDAALDPELDDEKRKKHVQRHHTANKILFSLQIEIKRLRDLIADE